jgi:hypothetical protein
MNLQEYAEGIELIEEIPILKRPAYAYWLLGRFVLSLSPDDCCSGDDLHISFSFL